MLLAAEARAVLATAMAAAGAHVGDVRLSQVRYRPRRSVTATYRVDIDGSPATLVAHGGAGIPDGAVLLESGDVRVGVWRYPNDPLLPGLRHAVDGDLLPRLLAHMGIAEQVVRVRRRAYRPTRRAVVEATTGQRRLYLKVVRPEKAEALRSRHDALAPHGAAPPVVGAAPHLGVLALAAVDGAPLRDRLGGGALLPEPAQLTDLLDRLPGGLAAVTPGPAQRVAGHSALLAAVLPSSADRLADLAGRLGPGRRAEPAPAHGDFHPGQVMVRDGGVVGLIDVDAAGTGERLDDLATMLAYLAASGADPVPPPRSSAYGAQLEAAFARSVDTVELRRRAAAAIVGFATIPFVSQRAHWPARILRRLEQAERWAAVDGELWL